MRYEINIYFCLSRSISFHMSLWLLFHVQWQNRFIKRWASFCRKFSYRDFIISKNLFLKELYFSRRKKVITISYKIFLIWASEWQNKKRKKGVVFYGFPINSLSLPIYVPFHCENCIFFAKALASEKKRKKITFINVNRYGFFMWTSQPTCAKIYISKLSLSLNIHVKLFLLLR